MGAHWGSEGGGSPQAGVTGELPVDMGAGSQTPILSKSSK